MPDAINVALIGARGYVGFELINLIDKHPMTHLVAAFSREYNGQKISGIIKGFSDKNLKYCADTIESIKNLKAEVIFLALPNDIAAKYDDLWQSLQSDKIIIDLSSDFRFDSKWKYSQPETSSVTSDNPLIANPGCYATAGQLGLLPIKSLVKGTPEIFGVSGYSGAGSKPSDKNNPARLKNNLMAYKLTQHIHEKEISQVLGYKVNFMPHVAEFFRGIHLTLSVNLKTQKKIEDIYKIYHDFYRNKELINVSTEIPEVQAVQNTHNVNIGGFSIDGTHLVLCVTIDNLLKGAATQAIQNMNLALKTKYNLEMNTGITQ